MEIELTESELFDWNEMSDNEKSSVLKALHESVQRQLSNRKIEFYSEYMKRKNSSRFEKSHVMDPVITGYFFLKFVYPDELDFMRDTKLEYTATKITMPFRNLEGRYDNIGITFVEFDGIVMDALQKWYNKTTSSVSPKGCDLYYWTTDPSGRKIHYACKFTGVVPFMDPGSRIDSDLTVQEKREYKYQFRCEDWTSLNWDEHREECEKVIEFTTNNMGN